MALNKDRIFKAADKYIRSSKIEKAIGEYETWLKENPKDWNTIRIVGDLYARISRNDEAIKKYAQVADHYRRDGFNVRAIATYKMVLRLDPGNEAAMRNLAELQAEEGLLMEAKSYFQTLVELYNKQGHKRLAAEVFKKLADIDPTDLKIRYKYAEFLTKQGKPDEAALEFVGIADQFIGQGKVDEAVRILEQGRSMAPTDPSLQVKLAHALTLQGNHAQAVRFLEEVRQSHPNDANVLGRLGEAHLAAGNTEAAESAFQQLMNLDPANPATAIRLADLRIAQGKYDSALEQLTPLVDRRVAEHDAQKATELLQKVLAKEPYHVKTLLKLAEVHTILKQDSGRISAYDSLCEAYNRAGDYEKAVQVAEQLVELDPESSQHKDRLKFFKSKLAAPPPAPAPAAAPPPALAVDQDLPELDLGGEDPDVDADVSVSFDDELSLDEPEAPASAPAPVPAVDFGDVVELTQEDEENIKEKLTEAEVFVRYGLVDKAIAQLVDVLESFRFHLDSREKLIEIYKDQGMNREAAEQLVHLGQVYDKLGQPQEAQRARNEAAELNPALAAHAAAVDEAHDELELTLESEADLSDAGIEIDVPPPEEPVEIPVEAPMPQPAAPVEEDISISIDDSAFEEPEIDIAIEGVDFDVDANANADADAEPEAEPAADAFAVEEASFSVDEDVSEEIPLDIGLTGEEVDFLAGGDTSEPVVEESSDDISIAIDDEISHAGGLDDVVPSPELALDDVAADEDIEIDLALSSEDVSFSVESEAAAPPPVVDAPEPELEAPEPVMPEPVMEDVALETEGIDDEIDITVHLPAEGPVDVFSVDIEETGSDDAFSVELPESEELVSEDDEPFAATLEGLSDDDGPEIELDIPQSSPPPERIVEPGVEIAPEAEQIELDEPLSEIDISSFGMPSPEPSLPSPEPPPPAAAPPATAASPLASELAEVDEYITLGLYEDARDTLRDLLKQHPGDAAVLAKIEELGFSAEQIQREAGEQQRLVAPLAPPAAQPASVATPPAPPVPEPELEFELETEPALEHEHAAVGSLEDELAGIESLVAPSEPEPAEAFASGGGGDFIDLASELSEEIFGTHSAVEDDESEAEGPLTDPGLDQIFREFRKGVEKQLGTEDYDTRYNLGIAYKEMGLLDEAIAEFQLAAKDEVRGLECCSMLGLCFMEKGMPDIAIKWFSKGLSIPGRRAEEYHGLRYDLAQAYEAANQLEKALSLYMEIFRENASFRDVKDRVRELQAARK